MCGLFHFNEMKITIQITTQKATQKRNFQIFDFIIFLSLSMVYLDQNGGVVYENNYTHHKFW